MVLAIKGTPRQLFIQHTLLIFFFAAAYYFAHLYLIQSKQAIDGGLVHPVEYIIDDTKHGKKKHKDISFFHCVRFSLVTQTTVGYGSLVPTHSLTQYINILQLITIYGVLILSLV